jgi:hypothetical protein
MRYSFTLPRNRDQITKDRARRIRIALDNARAAAPSPTPDIGVQAISDDEDTRPIRMPIVR